MRGCGRLTLLGELKPDRLDAGERAEWGPRASRFVVIYSSLGRLRSAWRQHAGTSPALSGKLAPPRRHRSFCRTRPRPPGQPSRRAFRADTSFDWPLAQQRYPLCPTMRTAYCTTQSSVCIAADTTRYDCCRATGGRRSGRTGAVGVHRRCSVELHKEAQTARPSGVVGGIHDLSILR